MIGSQAVHALNMSLPPVAFLSPEADVYPRHRPELAEEIDGAIGQQSQFHDTFGYYAHGIGPETAVLPARWEQRLVRLEDPNTGGATGLCLEIHDLVLSKYAAGREKDHELNRALIAYGCVSKRKLLFRVRSMPLDEAGMAAIVNRIKADFSAATSRTG